jgi:hypothetical protein
LVVAPDKGEPEMSPLVQTRYVILLIGTGIEVDVCHIFNFSTNIVFGKFLDSTFEYHEVRC